MPERATLIAVLIMERPLCVACISSKSGLTSGEVESYLASIQNTVNVQRGQERCRVCRNLTTTYWLFRSD
jgi:hypothetical protein